jgi:hypothetical protein
MVLNEESGVDGKDLAVGVESYAITGFRITLTTQVSDKVVLEPAHGNEGGAIIRYKILSVDGALKDAAILVDGVFRKWCY